MESFTHILIHKKEKVQNNWFGMNEYGKVNALFFVHLLPVEEETQINATKLVFKALRLLSNTFQSLFKIKVDKGKILPLSYNIL